MLNNRKLGLNTTTRAIRDAAFILTQRPTINWIPAHTGIPGNKKAERLRTRYNTYYQCLLDTDSLHCDIKMAAAWTVQYTTVNSAV